MGSDVTAKALQHQIPRFRNIGKLQLQALQSGGDPKDVDIGTTVKDNQGQKLAVYFSFCTAHFLFCTFPFCTQLYQYRVEQPINALYQTFQNISEGTALLVA